MTLQEIRSSDKVMLIPADICGVLGCAQYSINVQAQEDPRKLGFPVSVIGTRVRIPRVAFLKWIEGAGMWSETEATCAVQTAKEPHPSAQALTPSPEGKAFAATIGNGKKTER